jgi:hypothetical protein
LPLNFVRMLFSSGWSCGAVIRIRSRSPTVAALSSSTVLAEYVYAGQVELPGGFQHVAVVCIDLLKAMLPGAGQVQRVTGSEEHRARHVEDRLAGLFQQIRSHSKSLSHTVPLILFEVFCDRRHLPASEPVHRMPDRPRDRLPGGPDPRPVH